MTAQGAIGLRFFWIVPFFIAAGLSFGDWYDPKKNYGPGEQFEIPLELLRPTQLTIGQREVEYRKRKLKKIFKESYDDYIDYLNSKPTDVILGPKKLVYIIDGHHFARALRENGWEFSYAIVEKDWSWMSEKMFEKRMQNLNEEHDRAFVYLRDAQGKLHTWKELPETLDDLQDDPLRSVAFYLVRTKILKKDDDFPFYGEYAVVEWLRSRIELTSPSGRSRLWHATKEAARLISSEEAQEYNLPGQRYLTPEKCEWKLRKLGKYYVHQ